MFLVGPLCDAAAAAAGAAPKPDATAPASGTSASPAAATPAAEAQSNKLRPETSTAAVDAASDSGASDANQQQLHQNGAAAAVNGSTQEAEDAAEAEEAKDAEEADAVARGLSAAGLMRRMARLADERCGPGLICPTPVRMIAVCRWAWALPALLRL